MAVGDSGQRTEPAGWQYWPREAGGAEGLLDGVLAGRGWHGCGRGAEPGVAAAEADTESLIKT